MLDSELEEKQVADFLCSKYTMGISVHLEVCILEICSVSLSVIASEVFMLLVEKKFSC